MKKILIFIFIILSIFIYSETDEDKNFDNAENIENIEIIEETEKSNNEIDEIIKSEKEENIKEQDKTEEIIENPEIKKIEIKKELKKDILKPVEKEIEKKIIKVDKNSGVYLLDYDKFVFENEIKRIHPLASLTKLMTAIIIYEEVEKGNISLDDEIEMTSKTYNIGGSWLNTRIGTKYTVQELLSALLVYSANNAAYALANYVSNNNLSLFVNKMNEKARLLGMNDTIYYTPSGLPTSFTGQGIDVSTVEDQVKLTKYYIKIEKLMQISNQSKIILKNGNGREVEYNNRNKILHTFGNIGLKTGFHDTAGYNMVGVYNKDGVRYIVITMGDESDNLRFKNQLNLEKQVSNNIYPIIKKNNFNMILKLENSRKKDVKLYILEEFYGLRNYNYEYQTILYKDKYTKVEKDEEIGKIIIKNEDNIIKEISMYSSEESKEKIAKIYFVLPVISILISAIYIYVRKKR